MPMRSQLLTSVFTNSNYVCHGLRCFLVPGIRNFVIDLIQDVTHCTRPGPYHLSRRLLWTDVISSLPSLYSDEAEGASSLSLVPQIKQIIAWSLQWSHYTSGLSPCFATVEHSWANAGLIHLVAYPKWEVFGGEDRQEFCELSTEATQHLTAMVLSKPPLEHSIPPR